MRRFKELHIYSNFDRETRTVTRSIKDENGRLIFQCKNIYPSIPSFESDPVCILECILQGESPYKDLKSQTAISDMEIRLRTLEIMQNIHNCQNPFELISRSIALARYVKTGKYCRFSGDAKELEDEYMNHVYDKLSEKRYETKQPAYNTYDKADIPKNDVSFFKKLLSRFRNK